MGKKEILDDAVNAYVESTGNVPDTRDFVALEDAVDNYVAESDEENSDS